MLKSFGDLRCIKTIVIKDFKSEMRLNRDAFNYILDVVHDQIVLTPKKLKPNPTLPHQLLGLTIYYLATGCKCKTLLRLSVPSVNEFLNKICRILVGTLYNQYINMSVYQKPILSGQLKSRGF